MNLEERVPAARAAIQEALRAGAAACVTSSFQADCVALVHLVAQEMPDIPVLFLDTGYHFAETYRFRDAVVEELRLNLVNVLPKLTVTQQETQFGLLYETAPDRCCGMRKVEPLFASLEPFDTWFTALRREQSPTRANLRVSEDFRLPSGKNLRKVSPLADWSMRDVWEYDKAHGLEFLPLYELGYTSIGCEPCTALPADADHPRSGRWGGRKLECGIHIQPDAETEDQHA